MLARAQRAAGHPAQALTLYKSYLRHVPRSEQRPQVEATIRDLENKL